MRTAEDREKDEKKIMKVIRDARKSGVTLEAISSLTGVQLSLVRTTLLKLRGAGQVERIGTKKASAYRLPPK
jgi:hypothetical protein